MLQPGLEKIVFMAILETVTGCLTNFKKIGICNSSATVSPGSSNNTGSSLGKTVGYLYPCSKHV